MTVTPVCDLHSWLRMVGEQCLVLTNLIRSARLERLTALTWYGHPLDVLAREPHVLLSDSGASLMPVTSAHGFTRYIYKSPLAASKPGAAPTVWKLPGIASQPWHDDSALARRLELQADHLIFEFMRNATEFEEHPDSAEIVDEGTWRAAFLTGLKQQPERETLAFWRRVAADDFCETFGFAAYFRTSAGTTFRRHHGSTNLRIRHHLCVAIGADTDARIEVGGERRRWRLGKCLAFDDSFPHEIVHHKGSDRVVLCIDAWHPDLTPDERRVLTSPLFYMLGKT